ncbi:MAG TPA: carboxypeptidase regulatory-like domain-containing protein [Gemmataceae bacterium]
MPSNRMKSLCLSLLASLPMAAGCNRGPADLAAPNSSDSPEVRKEIETSSVPVPQGKAILAGRVVFEGTPPKARPINFGPEKPCAELHAHAPLFSESLVVNPNGTVKWMLVSIKGKVPGEHKPPAEPVVMDQVGCVFVPHAVAMMAGQEVEFRNSDPFTHNVRVTPKVSAGSNLIFTTKAVRRVEMGRAELGIPIRCDIHFWMSAYLHVLSHPFFAVTGDDGSFLLNGVPPGTYTLQTWHETLKPQTRTVTVQAGERKTVNFVFKSD